MSIQTKPTGVAWIGDIPINWKIQRMETVLFKRPKIIGKGTPACISFGRIVEKDEDRLSQTTLDSYQVIRPNEFIINPLNLNYDLKSLRTALSNGEYVVSSAYIVLLPRNGVEINYLKYFLRCYDIFEMKNIAGGVRHTVTFNDIKRSLACVPPLAEQQKIAAYLDELTALIDEQKRLLLEQIEHYKALKQSVIYEAVTKGLDRSAPMKPSGIAWIGDIPAHWQVKRFEKILKKLPKRKGSAPPGCISFGRLIPKDENALHQDTLDSYQLAKCNELVFNPLNLNYDLKSLRTAVAREELLISPAYIVTKISDKQNARFINYLARCFDIFEMKTLAGGVRHTITFSEVKRALVALPPLEEQIHIGEKLDSVCEMIEDLLQTIENQVSLLDELKKSKIYEAVTKGL